MSIDPVAAKDDKSSYGEIVKSSSMVGGSAMVKMVIGLAKAKAGAVFLGPEGVGLVGLYVSLMSMLANITSLGLNSSGVREVAVAVGSGDAVRVGQVICVLRRMCWLTGLLGWVVAAALALPLSLWTFGSNEHAAAIAMLGVVLLFGAVSAGQMALVQGMRRIASLAKFNVASAVLTAIVSIFFYWTFGLQGIIPAMVVGAALTLLNSWYFARQISVPTVEEFRFTDFLQQAKSLSGLGLSFMWSSTLQSASSFAKSAVVVKLISVEANGLLTAAWGISGLLASTVLGAMAADYYPRLTAASADNTKMRRLVDEQTEVGVLLSMPLIVGGVVFAPLVLSVIYSQDFQSATGLFQLFCLGMFAKMASWPMGFIMLAKGRAKLFAGVETISVVSHLVLALALLRVFGLDGFGWAFFIFNAVYISGMLLLARFLINYKYTKRIMLFMLPCVLIVAAGFLSSQACPISYRTPVGIILFAVSCYLSMRGLVVRLGPTHPIIRALLAIPGLHFFLGGPTTGK